MLPIESSFSFLSSIQLAMQHKFVLTLAVILVMFFFASNIKSRPAIEDPAVDRRQLQAQLPVSEIVPLAMQLPPLNSPLTYATSNECKNKQMPLREFLETVLFHKTIYDEFEGKTLKMVTWGNITKAFQKIFKDSLVDVPAGDDIIIAEVGSFLGGSTVDMARICRRLSDGRSCFLLAIDTWTGSSEHFEFLANTVPRSKFGNSRLFEVFMENVKYSNVTDIVVPIHTSSSAGSHILYCFRIRPHFIYIDGDHDYAAVQRDLYQYYPLLKDKGVLFGDDFGWPGVKKAVKEFVSVVNGSLQVVSFGTWVIQKKIM